MKVMLEDGYEVFFNLINDYLFILNEDRTIISFNSAVSKTFGYSVEELQGKSVLIFHPPETHEAATKKFEELLSGQSTLCTIPLITRGGRLIATETRVKIGTWQGNKAIFGICKDVSKLKNTEDKFHKLFKLNPSCMALTSYETWEYIDINDAMLELVECKKEELIGKKSNEIGIYDSLIKREAVVDELRKSGNVRNLELKIKTKTGKEITALFVIDPIELDGQKYLLSVLSDITKLKNTEKTLLEKKDDLETEMRECIAAEKDALKALRTHSEFIANMSHEIRTPLNTILGFTDILSSIASDERHQNYLDLIKSSSKSLLTLINDILDLSKLEAGKVEIRKAPVNPADVIMEMKKVFSLKITEKKLDFSLEIDGGLDGFFMLDETRLRQILFNLIGNALKFTERGGIKISAHIMSQDDFKKPDVNFSISVEDTGMGIPPEYLDKIFTPFSSTNEEHLKKYGGSGLGLSITKKLIETMGGRISVRSRLARGTVFTVFFNAVAKCEGGMAPLPAAAANFDKNGNIVFENSRILVVDDAPENRQLVKLMLKNCGLELLEAENGLIAVNVALKEKPDLIIMDIKMPVMNGYEAIDRIKGSEVLNKIPVIALTAQALSEDRQKIKEHKFDGCVFKPVQKNVIINEMAKFLKIKNVAFENVNNTRHFSPEETIVLKSEDAGMLPEIIRTLEVGLMPLWKKSMSTGSIDAIKNFGDELIKTGGCYHIDFIKRYGCAINEHVKHFEIKKLKEIIKTYPMIIDKLKNYKTSGDSNEQRL